MAERGERSLMEPRQAALDELVVFLSGCPSLGGIVTLVGDGLPEVLVPAIAWILKSLPGEEVEVTSVEEILWAIPVLEVVD